MEKIQTLTKMKTNMMNMKENTDSDENGDNEGYADLVEVELPYKIQNMDVLETIHNVFKAERIGNILIFKVSIF